MKFRDPELVSLFEWVLAFLTVATVVGKILERKLSGEGTRKVLANLNERIFAWWIMVVIFGAALALGWLASVILFALISFLALREFITLTPTRLADHRALFAAFFLLLPLHYWILEVRWYGMLAIFIPVYAFLFIPIRSALAGDSEHFLERTSKIQWGLMVCVYFLGYAPALEILEVPGAAIHHERLLFFLVFVTQISDVLQYVWGKLCGRRKIAPKLSPNKTVEGLIGGGLSATALGAVLWWLTPAQPLAAAGLAALCVAMGFFGGLVMSAIKRDRGVKDYGELLPGHGGMLDRIDGLCFAAPVFFHVVRYYYT